MKDAIFNLIDASERDARQMSKWPRDAHRLSTGTSRKIAKLDLDTFLSVGAEGIDLALMARSGGSRSLDGRICS